MVRGTPLWLVIAVACEVGPSPGDDGTTELVCRVGVEATGSGMTITSLVVDGSPLLAAFNASGRYNEVTQEVTDGDSGQTQTIVKSAEPAACLDATSHTATWIFEVGAEGFGRVTLAPGTSSGNIDMTTSGVLTIDLFGAPSPVVFTGSQFIDGSLFVESLEPTLAFDLNGNAQASSRSLQLNLAAEATP